MTHDLIRIRPAPLQRVPFARWAVSQAPQVRTVSHSEFGVPPGLFTGMPEELLVGSLVDGHAYVSPLEDKVTGAGRAPSRRARARKRTRAEVSPAAGTGAPTLLGVAPAAPGGSRLLSCGYCYEENGKEVHPHPECPYLGMREAVPGQPLPELPESAYALDAEPLPVPDGAELPDGSPGEWELSGTLTGTAPPPVSPPVPPRGDNGDSAGDMREDPPAGSERAPALTSGDTPEDSGDTSGDTRGDSARQFPCTACLRSFRSARGRDIHHRQVHGGGRRGR
ncbi:hypothetical protein [Streptomyces sp. CA-253872]|uniref:hypothetical protein n=1 Tax=Streptomyces sp. CA-253872 TaxID=3240067 RepID=UPI003D8F6282